MLIVDADLDKKPTSKKVQKLAELRIHNLLCQSELIAYNSTGHFLYKHPLIEHENERSRLERLWRSDKEEFMKEYSRCIANVSRYRSYLKNPARKKTKAADTENYHKHMGRQEVFLSIINR